MSRPYDRAAWDKARASSPTVTASALSARPAPTNAERLETFVSGHIVIARRKDTIAAARHLSGWARFLDQQIARLGAGKTGDVPPHLRDLDAVTLANARDRLLAAIKEKP